MGFELSLVSNRLKQGKRRRKNFSRERNWSKNLKSLLKSYLEYSVGYIEVRDDLNLILQFCYVSGTVPVPGDTEAK